MSILRVIPFGKDGTSGDSSFSTDISFPYHNEMTLKELQTLTYEYFMKEWGYDTIEDFLEDNVDNEVVGGWVILDDYLRIINTPVMCGGDSSCYAVNNLMKEQAKKASNVLID